MLNINLQQPHLTLALPEYRPAISACQQKRIQHSQRGSLLYG